MIKFDIIGISEHKIRKGSTSKYNIDIPGYQSFIFQPIESSHGGTGFYLKNNINNIDLALKSTGNFESTVTEINFPKRKNLIVVCIHRHPTSKISIHDFKMCDTSITYLLDEFAPMKKVTRKEY